MKPSPSNQKILVSIGDDGQGTRLLMIDLLESAGFDITEAANGRIAVAKAIIKNPDLILMDLNRSEIDGLTAIRVLKATQSTRCIPIAAVIPSEMAASQEPIADLGCDGYIAAPIDPAGFLSQIRQLILPNAFGANPKPNCWEYMQCGQDPQDRLHQKQCPAVYDTKFNDVNGGFNGGRVCWKAAGAFSGFVAKKQCLDCSFFKAVMKEEGSIFQFLT